jgi:hypothetical protein
VSVAIGEAPAAAGRASEKLSLRDRAPIFAALSESGLYRVSSDTTPDEMRTVLTRFSEALETVEPLDRAVGREYAVRHLRDCGYVEAGRVLEAALGRDIPPSNSANDPRKGRACRKLVLETAEELLADEWLAKDAGWVVEGLIVRGGLTVPYGPPKVGKGTWLLYAMRQVLAGEPCFGRRVAAGPVLWIDLEQGRRLMRRKIDEARAGGLLHPLHVYSGAPPTLAEVEDMTGRTAAVAIVIDSLSRFLGMENENDNAEMTGRIGPLVEMAQRLDVAIIPIHHERKSGGEHGAGMRGSSALFGLVDVAIQVKREPGDDETLRRLECVSRYDESNGRRLVIQRNSDFSFTLMGSPVDRRRGRTLDVIGSESLTLEEIAGRLEVTRQAADLDVRALHEAGRLSRTGTGKRGDPYRFAVSADARERAA